jgi:hypothetical protein
LEIAFLLYIVNEIEPIQSPKVEIKKDNLVWIRHDELLMKISRQEPKLNAEGKEVFKTLMSKLNKNSFQESEENEIQQKLIDSENLKQTEFNYEYPKSNEPCQSNFEF